MVVDVGACLRQGAIGALGSVRRPNHGEWQRYKVGVTNIPNFGLCYGQGKFNEQISIQMFGVPSCQVSIRNIFSSICDARMKRSMCILFLKLSENDK